MKNFIEILSKKSTGNILALSIVVIFLILGAVRLYPYQAHNDLDNILISRDDWRTFAECGLDIKRNGMLMPSTKGPYSGSGGILYSYFLALCFLIFGENVVPVYFIQHIMIGLSVAFMYWAFRDKMRGLTGTLFLGALALFAFLDVSKYYAVRLLTENLAFFTISLFFFCFIKGFEKNNLKLQLLSALLMGSLIITRTNYFICAFVIILVVVPFYFKRRPKGIANLVLFILVMALSGSLLGVRNYLACGEWRFLPSYATPDYILARNPVPPSVDLSGIATNPVYKVLRIDKTIISPYLEYIRQEPLMFFKYYFKRVLFCFGFTPILVDAYRFRPHWTLMWLGYFAYFFFHFKDRQRFKMWEIAVHLYLFTYYGSLIASTDIHNYGFRMLIPATNFVLVFFFLAWDRVFYRKRFT